MDKIFHGCAMGYRDGTIILIDEKFLLPVNDPFWKDLEDIPNGV